MTTKTADPISKSFPPSICNDAQFDALREIDEGKLYGFKNKLSCVLSF